jgi:hypothetical protein
VTCERRSACCCSRRFFLCCWLSSCACAVRKLRFLNNRAFKGFKALLRAYLLQHYPGSIQALLRLYSGSAHLHAVL